MSQFVTLYGVYWISPSRTQGGSEFFETQEEAERSAAIGGLETRIQKQTYEIDDDGHHDCGDDE